MKEQNPLFVEANRLAKQLGFANWKDGYNTLCLEGKNE